ncbi:hypothetical protein FRB91_002306 [Serendipita sp. 411]|nr:hypothetical protein FRC15_006133 [Serendipita sp. 397]KAG8793306.1 hypothetical protein FRC16_011011 [Serendipita sp. 398]KAG8800078.1 hypothetical protein FRC18_008116 [Serendipita sp. 400]KAG8844811.1 hypothetical protein FRB91_002306 [Serendipita sp. 411]KAG8862694.1 hypothetical protein FRC20_011072 [Serendipita sp. 405]
MSYALSSLTGFFSSRSYKPLVEKDEILPLELWKLIIDYIIDEIRHPYRYCTAATFPQYQARFNLADKIEKDPTLGYWKSIRSVCRTWRQLAGHQPHLFLQRVPKDDTRQEMSKAAFSAIVHGNNQERAIMQSLVLDPSLSHKLTTLILSQDAHRHGIDVVLENPSSFPNLRCLSVVSTRTRQPFWEAIQNGYPQLVSLTIRNYVGNSGGAYKLNHLEILDLDSWMHFRLSCPSLKHIAVRNGRGGPLTEFLMEHGHHIESILIDGNVLIPAVAQRHDLGSTFPKIQTFGRQAGMPIWEPLRGYPIKHLRVFPRHNYLDVEGILKEVDLFTEVTTVHVRPADLKSGTMGELRARFQERSIQVVDVPNIRPVSDSKLPSIMSWLGVICTCPCWSIMLMCTPISNRVSRTKR